MRILSFPFLFFLFLFSTLSLTKNIEARFSFNERENSKKEYSNKNLNRIANSKYEGILKDIRLNQSSFFLQVSFSELTEVFFYFLQRKPKGQSLIHYIASNEFDFKIKLISSFLKGTKNKDPRVRTVSLFLLKDLITDLKKKPYFKTISFKKYLRFRLPKEKRLELTLDKNSLSSYYKKEYQKILKNVIKQVSNHLVESFYLETAKYTNYCVFNLEGYGEFLNTYTQMRQLTFYLVRNLSIDKINKGEIKASQFESMNPIVFLALTETIYAEKKEQLPIYEVKDKLSILYHALKHPYKAVYERAAHFLAEAYYSKTLSLKTKKKIEDLKKQFPILEEIIKKYPNILLLEKEMEKYCSDLSLNSKEMNDYYKILKYLKQVPKDCYFKF